MSDLSNFDQIMIALTRAREDTFKLLNWIRDPLDLFRRANPAFRPIFWHVGHIGAFEEWWFLRKLRGAPAINPHFQLIFDPIKTPRDHPDSQLSRDEIEEYVALVRSRTLNADLDQADPYFLRLVLEHELQHHETLAMLMQMLPPERKRAPFRPPDAGPGAKMTSNETVKIPAGIYRIGAKREPFVYDNEEPQHEIELEEYSIDKYLVTNGDYEEFIKADSYKDRKLWSEEGWEWKEREAVTKPEYWLGEGPWQIQQMFATRDVAAIADHPVTGVGWHEAMAYARFAGKRLLTEEEWEAAASVVRSSNCCAQYLGTTPVGAIEGNQTASGCFDMTGNLWEWTSTTFGPYAGFEAHPYPEYSELWFDGDHRVLRGGSWMTQHPLTRTTFRNFFRSQFRFAFAGIRCALV